MYVGLLRFVNGCDLFMYMSDFLWTLNETCIFFTYSSINVRALKDLCNVRQTSLDQFSGGYDGIYIGRPMKIQSLRGLRPQHLLPALSPLT